MNSLFRYSILPLILSLLIFIVTCLITTNSIPSLPEGLQWDKIAHFGMFFLLSAVIMYDYYRMQNKSPSSFRWIFWGLIVPVFYGGLIELLQKYFFYPRNAEWGDWIADIVGALTATLLSIVILKKKH
jgi:VanZ family protein